MRQRRMGRSLERSFGVPLSARCIVRPPRRPNLLASTRPRYRRPCSPRSSDLLFIATPARSDNVAIWLGRAMSTAIFMRAIKGPPGPSPRGSRGPRRRAPRDWRRGVAATARLNRFRTSTRRSHDRHPERPVAAIETPGRGGIVVELHLGDTQMTYAGRAAVKNNADVHRRPLYAV